MATFDIFGARYQLPEVRDARFAALQDDARQRRELLDKARHTRRLLGFIPVPGPRLTEEERLAQMEALLNNYEEIQVFLKTKAADLNRAFDSVAHGVAGVFHERAEDIRAQERKRQSLHDRSARLGEQDVLETVRAAEEHNRDLSTTLARAVMVILKNIEAARLAVAALAGSKHVQEGVLANLQDKVQLYRAMWDYKREAQRLQSDIEEITRIALDFNGILREQLGPVYELVREVGRVDDSVARSMAEVEVLTRQLASGASFDRFGGDPENDPLVAALVYRELSEDLVQDLVRRMEDPIAHIESSEALQIDREAEGVPVMTVLENIEMVINMQVRGTLGSHEAVPALLPSPSVDAAPPVDAPSESGAPRGSDLTPLWSFPFPRARAIACTTDKIAVLDGAALTVLDAADGTQVARFEIDGASHVVAAGDRFLVAAGTRILDFRSGVPTVIASFDEVITAFAADGDDVVSGTVGGSITFGNWRTTVAGRSEQIAVTVGSVAVVTNRKELVVLDRPTGEKQLFIPGIRCVTTVDATAQAVVHTDGTLELVDPSVTAVGAVANASASGARLPVNVGRPVAAGYPGTRNDGAVLVLDGPGGESVLRRTGLARLFGNALVEHLAYTPDEPVATACAHGEIVYILTRGRTLHALQL